MSVICREIDNVRSLFFIIYIMENNLFSILELLIHFTTELPLFVLCFFLQIPSVIPKALLTIKFSLYVRDRSLLHSIGIVSLLLAVHAPF